MAHYTITNHIKKARVRLNLKLRELEELSKLSQILRDIAELNQQTLGRILHINAMQQQEPYERTRQLDLKSIDMTKSYLADSKYGYYID